MEPGTSTAPTKETILSADKLCTHLSVSLVGIADGIAIGALAFKVVDHQGKSRAVLVVALHFKGLGETGSRLAIAVVQHVGGSLEQYVRQDDVRAKVSCSGR